MIKAIFLIMFQHFGQHSRKSIIAIDQVSCLLEGLKPVVTIIKPADFQFNPQLFFVKMNRVGNKPA